MFNIKKIYKNIKNPLKELFYGKCRFYETCELYQHDHPTCNTNAGPYCGRWRMLLTFKE